MNIPNKITVSRIVIVLMMIIALFVLDLTPGFVSPYIGNSGINVVYLVVAVVFIIGALTDKLDGTLARKWNQVTDLGKFLDPIADKLLVDSLLLYLIVPHFSLDTLSISLWCVLVMIIRDLVVDALRLIAANKGVVLAANGFGKAKTVLQMVAIPLVLLNGWPFTYFDASWGYFRIASIIVYLATLMSLLSGAIYVIKNISVLKEKAK
ncbi:MAG: CDP-diacylglycerol--glycerol-3-phosphate 3-phosphatidyltransferase [Bacilli bacterium]|jgi:CDP-diacylglycerol--glycerol-3-phosphate 3-phosphatidyltransferase|nr:CDP-diacylglycerol--glycerol-3-phosphate 3-phosphatidyltransferase [Bacilli bacterium]